MRCAIFIGLLVTVIALGEARTISSLGREHLWFTGDNNNDQNNHHNNNNDNTNYNNEDNSNNEDNNIGSEHQRLQELLVVAPPNAPAMIAEAIREYQDDDRTPSATLEAFHYVSICILHENILFIVPKDAWYAEDATLYKNEPWFRCYMAVRLVEEYTRCEADRRKELDHVFLLHVENEKCHILYEKKVELERAIEDGDLVDPEVLKLIHDMSIEVHCHCQQRGSELAEPQGKEKTRSIRLRRSSERSAYSPQQYARSSHDECRLKLTSAVLDAITYAADCLLVKQHTDKRFCSLTLDAVKQFAEGDEKIVGKIEKFHAAYRCSIGERISDEYESAVSDWRSGALKDEDVQRIVKFIKKKADSFCRADESHDQKRLPEPMIQQLEDLLRELQK